MQTALENLLSIPVKVPDGVEIRVTITDRRGGEDDEWTFEPALSRDAIYRDWTLILPFYAACKKAGVCAEGDRP